VSYASPISRCPDSTACVRAWMRCHRTIALHFEDRIRRHLLRDSLSMRHMLNLAPVSGNARRAGHTHSMCITARLRDARPAVVRSRNLVRWHRKVGTRHSERPLRNALTRCATLRPSPKGDRATGHVAVRQCHICHFQQIEPHRERSRRGLTANSHGFKTRASLAMSIRRSCFVLCTLTRKKSMG
jgi:hypothetical protein